MIELEYIFPNTQNDYFLEEIFRKHPLKLIILNNEVWIRVDSFSDILQLKKHQIQKHIRTLPTEWKKRVLHETQNDRIQLVNDAGLVSFTCVSHSPRARNLEHWITQELLPTIRDEYLKENKKVQKQVEQEPQEEAEVIKTIPKVQIEDEEPLNLDFFGDEDEW